MQVTRTYNSEEVDEVLKDQSVFNGITDDSCPKKESFSVRALMENKSNVVLMVREGRENIGCFICLKCSPSTYEGHICLTSKCRGKSALTALSLGANWLFTNTDAFRILGLTPQSNRPALSVTRLAGYERIGIREKAVSILGKIQDVIQSELTLYKWLDTLTIECEKCDGLDTLHLKHLYLLKRLVESGKSSKAAFLLSEFTNQSYSKNIIIQNYPLIEVDSKTININKLFKE